MRKEISVAEEQVNCECRSRGILFLIYFEFLICDIISVSTERKLRRLWTCRGRVHVV